jgi:UDP-galactopyranose mutase
MPETWLASKGIAAGISAGNLAKAMFRVASLRQEECPRANMEADYIIVGSGLTGATIARLLADNGDHVIVVERRSHVGGNVHDYVHQSGIRVHTYGPHYFRTSSDRVWSYMRRFGTFYEFAAVVMSSVQGRLEDWPVHVNTITRVAGKSWVPGYSGVIRNFEQASLAVMPTSIYQEFVKGYTSKQWGVEPERLESSLAARFDVRTGADKRLKLSRYQGLPHDGYSRLMEKMLAGIELYKGVDYLQHRSGFKARRKVVYTGPIDEFFSFDRGALKYRGQLREHVFLPGVRSHQPVPQVNYPGREVPFIRQLEWKHMMRPEETESVDGTLVTTETPYTPDEPSGFEYPFPDDMNRRLYRQYRERANRLADTVICGRLGEYKYLDMDQAVARALMIADRLIRKEPVRL